jgi:DNA modification methylase
MKAVMTGFKPLPDGQANIRAARDKQRGHSRKHSGFNDRWDQMPTEEQMSMGANKRSVWSVSTKPFKDAHFATFPEDLIVDMIKAGSKVDDTILDMFMGAGTTALVARKLQRNFIGSELNPDYIKIANKRLDSLGMFR